MKIFIFLIILSFSNNKDLINHNIIDTAKYFYKKKNFYKALKLYNYINSIYNYNKDIIYIQAMCNFYTKNYILAALNFKKYYELHINKKFSKIESGLYNYIYSLYLLSYDYNLDQTNTYNAIYGIKEFIKKYPNSNKKININIILKILLKKIEKKEFETSKINFHIENYQSAFLNFKNFIIKYPNSKLIEKAFYYGLNAQVNFAFYSKNQIFQEKRLQKAIDFYDQFIEIYPIYQYNAEKIIYNIKNILKKNIE